MSAEAQRQRQLVAALSAEDWSTAERLLRDWAARPDAPAAVAFNLGQVLLRVAKADEAGGWYERAVETDPTHADAWCELGAWRMERFQTEAAADAYAQALSLRPDDSDALLGGARAAMRLGDWESAAAFWSALLKRQPALAEARYGLLRTALETGDPQALAMRRALAQDAAHRPLLLKTLTRTASGSVPLSPRDL